MYRLHPRPARSARSLPVLGLTAVLAAAGLACASGVPALAVPAARSAPPASGARAAAPPGAVASSSLASPVRRPLLINGDRLAVTTTGGRPTMALWPAARRDAITSLRLGGQVLEVPIVALPYLRRGLSPSLFQLSN